MLGDALSYPSNGDDWLKTLLIGVGLMVTSFLIIPGVMLSGYTVRILRSAARGEDTPPSFGEWAELLVDGLKMTGISIAYLIIPYVISIALVFAGQSSGGIVGMIISLLGLLLVLVAAYILPVALTNFALTENVDAAFEIRRIVNAAFTTQYFASVVLAFVVGLVLGLIAGLLSLLLIGLPLLFYVMIATYYLYGRGCGSMLQTEPEGREQVSGPSSPSR